MNEVKEGNVIRKNQQIDEDCTVMKIKELSEKIILSN